MFWKFLIKDKVNSGNSALIILINIFWNCCCGSFSSSKFASWSFEQLFCRLSFPKSFKTLLHYLHYQFKFWSFWTSCFANYQSGQHFCPYRFFHLQIVPLDKFLILFANFCSEQPFENSRPWQHFANCCSKKYFCKLSFRATILQIVVLNTIIVPDDFEWMEPKNHIWATLSGIMAFSVKEQNERVH